MMEQAAILGQRLDILLSEAERLETELVAEGRHMTARDLANVALELRLARRSLACLLQSIEPSPSRAVRLLNGSTA